MQKVWRAMCVVVFITGAVSYSQVSQVRSEETGVEPATSFVVTYTDSTVSPDGTVTVTGWHIRYVKADGEWRLVLHGPKSDSGAVAPPVFAGTPEGLFGKGSGSDHRKLFAPPPPKELSEAFRSHEFFANHKQMARTDQVAGLKVYVLRTEIVNPESPQQWVEISYSPKTGRHPLRSIDHLRDGSEIRSEATKVEFKEIPDDLNADVKALPIQEDKPRN